MFDFSWVRAAESVHSGYKHNDIGWLLYGLVRSHNPINCVEIGVLHGYSTIYIGAALRDNNDGGMLNAYDLFDTYPYRNAKQDETAENIRRAGLTDIIWLHRASAVEVSELVEKPLDFVHIDISNDGETYQWAIETFGPLMRPNALLVMEGGTLERDDYEWMIEFDKPPIIPVLASLIGWNFFVFQPFPGLTIMRKMS